MKPNSAIAGASLETRVARVYELMPEVAGFAQRRALQLSGGQQKLVAFARALMSGTHLLLSSPTAVASIAPYASAAEPRA